MGGKGANVWLRRYGWAELAALVLSLGCALLADMWTDNALLMAASAYGGSIGYYGALLGRELHHARRPVLRSVRAIMTEFAGAEALDSLVFSPVLLYLCVALVPNVALAVLLSEIASTAMFYAMIMIGHKRCIAGAHGAYLKIK